MHCLIHNCSLHQSWRRACRLLLLSRILTKETRQTNCRSRSAPSFTALTPPPNPHSARGTARALPHAAISCIGAFRTPAVGARGEFEHTGVRKPAQVPTLPRRTNYTGLACCSTETGSVNENVEPCPTTDSTQIFPPCISIIRFEMASPRPVPPFLRVIELSACWNSWKSLA